MATTRLIAHHISKGQSILKYMNDCFDYRQNFDKLQKEYLTVYIDRLEKAEFFL